MQVPARQTRARKTISKRPITPGTWPLLVIDSTPIRNAAREQYEAVIREVDQAKAIRHRFHNQDRPQYQKWLSSRFGGILTELRELSSQWMELEQLVDDVEGEFFFGDYDTLLEAYEAVMKRRNRSPDEIQEDEEDEDDEGWKNLFGDMEEEVEEDLKNFFNSAFGPETDDDSGGSGKKARSRTPKAREQTSENSRLKSLYRELARRLHPDQADNPTSQHLEWWLETQQAYETGNVERLEIILTLTELEQPGAKQSSVSVLQKVTAHIRKSLLLLKTELKQFRKDPAWNFSTLRTLDALEKKTEAELRKAKAEAICGIAEYQEKVQSWERLFEREQNFRSKRRRRRSS
jgi:hypothetical protein